MLRLWAHESKRVFEDRFINEEDIKIFRDYLKDALVKNIGEPDDKDNPLDEPMYSLHLWHHIKVRNNNIQIVMFKFLRKC